LAGILGLYAAVIGFGGTPLGIVMRLVLLGLLLGVAANLRDARDRRLWIVAGSALILAGSGLAVWLGSSSVGYAAVGACSALLIASMIANIATYLLRRRSVDISTVLGALCIYLLFALFFAGVHQTLAAFSTDYLHGTPDPPEPADLLYFSVITLTTVGFGDVTPVAESARAVTVLEALVGQLYLVSVVAGVVSSARAQRAE
jgi:hypothetical protein